jgi:hypothetical protein
MNPPKMVAEVAIYRLWKRLGVPPYGGGLLTWPAAFVERIAEVAMREGGA